MNNEQKSDNSSLFSKKDKIIEYIKSLPSFIKENKEIILLTSYGIGFFFQLIIIFYFYGVGGLGFISFKFSIITLILILFLSIFGLFSIILIKIVVIITTSIILLNKGIFYFSLFILLLFIFIYFFKIIYEIAYKAGKRKGQRDAEYLKDLDRKNFISNLEKRSYEVNKKFRFFFFLNIFLIGVLFFFSYYIAPKNILLETQSDGYLSGKLLFFNQDYYFIENNNNRLIIPSNNVKKVKFENYDGPINEFFKNNDVKFNSEN